MASGYIVARRESLVLLFQLQFAVEIGASRSTENRRHDMGLQSASPKMIMDGQLVSGQKDLHFRDPIGGRESWSKVREGFRCAFAPHPIDYGAASVYSLTQVMS